MIENSSRRFCAQQLSFNSRQTGRSSPKLTTSSRASSTPRGTRHWSRAAASNCPGSLRALVLVPATVPTAWRNDRQRTLRIPVFIRSRFLDSIAAAMIGGVVARTVFNGKVHIDLLLQQRDSPIQRFDAPDA